MFTVNKYFELISMTTASYNEFAKKNGLSYPVFVIYEHLYNSKEATSSEISNSWCIPKQTLHSAIKELLKENIIVTKENPNDRRTKLLVLTDKGLELATPIIERLNVVEKNAVEVLTVEERKKLYSLTEKLTKELIKEVKNG